MALWSAFRHVADRFQIGIVALDARIVVEVFTSKPVDPAVLAADVIRPLAAWKMTERARKASQLATMFALMLELSVDCAGPFSETGRR